MWYDIPYSDFWWHAIYLPGLEQKFHLLHYGIDIILKIMKIYCCKKSTNYFGLQ